MFKQIKNTFGKNDLWVNPSLIISAERDMNNHTVLTSLWGSTIISKDKPENVISILNDKPIHKKTATRRRK